MADLYDKQTELAKRMKEGTKQQNKKHEENRISLPTLLGKADKDYDFDEALDKLASNTMENQVNQARMEMNKQQYDRNKRHCHTVGNTDSEQCMPQYTRNRLTQCTQAYQLRNSHHWAGHDKHVEHACKPIRNSSYMGTIDPSKRQEEMAPSHPVHPLIYGSNVTPPAARSAFVADPSGCRTSSGKKTYCNPTTKSDDPRFNATAEQYELDNARAYVA